MNPIGYRMLGRAEPDVPAHTISRRKFFGGAVGAVLGSGLWSPARADHDRDERDDDRFDGPCPAPDPIPHITRPPPAPQEPLHFFFPGPVDGSAAPTDPTGVHPTGRDPSTMFNFDGVLGVADLNLTGTGTNTSTGESDRYEFHTDMRFMRGRFLATDGRVHRGTFVFI